MFGHYFSHSCVKHKISLKYGNVFSDIPKHKKEKYKVVFLEMAVFSKSEIDAQTNAKNLNKLTSTIIMKYIKHVTLHR